MFIKQLIYINIINMENEVYYFGRIPDYGISSYGKKCSLKHGTNERCYKNKIKKRRDKNKSAKNSRKKNRK